MEERSRMEVPTGAQRHSGAVLRRNTLRFTVTGLIAARAATML